MVSLTFNQFLALYVWFPLTVLLFIMLLIARFYQKFSGERTYFRFFVIPMILFGIASVRYAGVETINSDPMADLALISGGLTLSALSILLYWRMIVQKKREE